MKIDMSLPSPLAKFLFGMPDSDRQDAIKLNNKADWDTAFRGSNWPDSGIYLTPSSELPPDLPGVIEADFRPSTQESDSQE